MLSLKQAKVLRAMLHLGSFTAREIAEKTGEQPVYVMNLATKWKGRWIDELRLLKLGRVGPPEKVWFVKPESESQLLDELEPVYAERIKPPLDTYVYRFIDSDATDRSTCRQVRVLDEGKVLVSECDSHDEPTSANKVILDSSSVASGLAAVFKRTYSDYQGPVALVNLRGSVVHTAIVENGNVLVSTERGMFSFTDLGTSLANRLWSKRIDLIVQQVERTTQTFEAVTAKHIEGVFLTGDMEDFKSLRAEIEKKLSRTCSLFDPSESVEVELQSSSSRRSPITSVKCAAEIGYAVGQWERRMKILSRTKPSGIGQHLHGATTAADDRGQEANHGQKFMRTVKA